MFFSTKEFCNINRPFWCLCCLLHRRWCSCWRETPRRTWCPCILWDRAWSGPASIDLERGALRKAGNLGLDCVSHLELQLAVLLVKGEHAKVIVAGEVRKPPGRRFNGNYMCHQNPKSCLPTFWSVWGHSCCQGTEPPPKQSRCRNQVDLKNKSKTMCSDQDWTYQKTFPKVIVMTHHSLSALPVYQSHLLLLSSQSLPCWSWTKTFSTSAMMKVEVSGFKDVDDMTTTLLWEARDVLAFQGRRRFGTGPPGCYWTEACVEWGSQIMSWWPVK